MFSKFLENKYKYDSHTTNTVLLDYKCFKTSEKRGRDGLGVLAFFRQPTVHIVMILWSIKTPQ